MVGVTKLAGLNLELPGASCLIVMVGCLPENEANTKESGAEIRQISKDRQGLPLLGVTMQFKDPVTSQDLSTNCFRVCVLCSLENGDDFEPRAYY